MQGAFDQNLTPGTVLAGKYRVTRVLGRGGMGVVVEALHTQLDERVALKFLLPEFADRPDFAERFVREARAAVKIKGEHVARVTDVGTLENGAPYMVMEFMEGSDLGQLLSLRGKFAPTEAVDYVLQACEAIAEAHNAGIVHRDIKPSNLFLAQTSDGAQIVKVLDFGISKMAGATTDGLTKTTATMGSALYMSPEQMQNAKGVDHRADIYSLGITLYELLVGKQPYYAETLPELCALVLTGTPTPLLQCRPDLPPAFAAVVERAYARSRDHRFQTIAELAMALAPFAPPHARTSLDRIARFGGARVPPMQARTEAMASHPHLGAYVAPPTQPGVAAASTGDGVARTNAGQAGPFAGPAPRRRSMGVPIALGAAALIGVAAAAIVFTQGGLPGASAPAAAPTDAAAATQTAAAAPEEPPASSTAPAAASTDSAAASPADAASASPADSAAASPAASATAGAATALAVRPAGKKPPEATTSTPTAQPKATTTPSATNAFQHR
jgi:serine/threonine-protein kinase